MEHALRGLCVSDMGPRSRSADLGLGWTMAGRVVQSAFPWGDVIGSPELENGAGVCGNLIATASEQPAKHSLLPSSVRQIRVFGERRKGPQHAGVGGAYS